jgi:hypothetical protein
MVVAVVVFILNGAMVEHMHSQPMPSLEACELSLSAHVPQIERIAAQLSEQLGGEVIARYRCVDTRPSA